MARFVILTRQKPKIGEKQTEWQTRIMEAVDAMALMRSFGSIGIGDKRRPMDPDYQYVIAEVLEIKPDEERIQFDRG